VRTIERRLSAIAWNCAQHGQPLDRADRHIAEVMSGIRRRHTRPPDQKEAEVEIGRGSSETTCPVVALQTWLRLGRIAHGPLFRRIAGGGKEAGSDRLTDRHVARLVKRTALAAGVRGDLSEAERRQKFSGHSLRAGLATAAQVDERYVQRQLGHASAEMTRRYQRQRDRFRVNLTKAAGL
jgi:integrase